jgi:hypothetical protein
MPLPLRQVPRIARELVDMRTIAAEALHGVLVDFRVVEAWLDAHVYAKRRHLCSQRIGERFDRVFAHRTRGQVGAGDMSGPARGLGCSIVVLVQTEPAVESRKRGRQPPHPVADQRESGGE